MEGDKAKDSSRVVTEHFCEEKLAGDSSSSGLFNSVFPRPTWMGGKNPSLLDILDSPRKQGYKHQTSYIGKKSTGGVLKVDKVKTTSVYQTKRSDPFPLSSSLYYGGQDFCAQPANSNIDHKKDGKDDPDNSDIASRGNWWQGSLYY